MGIIDTVSVCTDEDYARIQLGDRDVLAARGFVAKSQRLRGGLLLGRIEVLAAHRAYVVRRKSIAVVVFGDKFAVIVTGCTGQEYSDIFSLKRTRAYEFNRAFFVNDTIGIKIVAGIQTATRADYDRLCVRVGKGYRSVRFCEVVPVGTD